MNYYSSYLNYVYAAKVQDKVDLRGYFAWSLLDNFEWEDGYTKVREQMQRNEQEKKKGGEREKYSVRQSQPFSVI